MLLDTSTILIATRLYSCCADFTAPASIDCTEEVVPPELTMTNISRFGVNDAVASMRRKIISRFISLVMNATITSPLSVGQLAFNKKLSIVKISVHFHLFKIGEKSSDNVNGKIHNFCFCVFNCSFNAESVLYRVYLLDRVNMDFIL